MDDDKITISMRRDVALYLSMLLEDQLLGDAVIGGDSPILGPTL
jgi:hypothetical protein